MIGSTKVMGQAIFCIFAITLYFNSVNVVFGAEADVDQQGEEYVVKELCQNNAMANIVPLSKLPIRTSSGLSCAEKVLLGSAKVADAVPPDWIAGSAILW